MIEVDGSTALEKGEMNANVETNGEQNTSDTKDSASVIKDNKAVENQRHRGKDEKRERKKDDKSVEHVLKALNSLNTTEEKLAAMCKKYADIFNDHRMLQNTVKQTEKRCSILQREKEQLQADHSKAILTRSTLENLCRELQRQNKAVKEESMMRIREEEEKRKEVSAKFQSTLNEITVMMQANNDKNTKLRDDNIDMTQKLKSVYEQYEKREQHIEKLAKQMQLEVQLSEAKLAKAKMEMAVEKETLLREKKQLLIEIAEYKTRLEEMQTTEQSLRTQITLYNNKYDEFHRALIQSNEAISGFKSEMDRMSKQIRRLERETGAWRGRYEAAQASLARMTEEKLRLESELGISSRKLAVLHRLCHTLQDNRKASSRGESAVHNEATLKAQMEEVKALEECPSKVVNPLLRAESGENGVETESRTVIMEIVDQADTISVISSTDSKPDDDTSSTITETNFVQNSTIKPIGSEVKEWKNNGAFLASQCILNGEGENEKEECHSSPSGTPVVNGIEEQGVLVQGEANRCHGEESGGGERLEGGKGLLEKPTTSDEDSFLGCTKQAGTQKTPNSGKKRGKNPNNKHPQQDP